MTATLIIHGGAGRMPTMSGPREAEYRDGLRAACSAGAAVLRRGGGALEASMVATEFMEDSGGFNAGLGSCMTMGGTIEMDAAVMEAGRRFGAVAGVSRVKNPVRLAHAIIEHTPHCILAAGGAEAFARQQGLAFREDFPSADRHAIWAARIAKLDPSKDLGESLAALGGVLGEADEGAEIGPATRGDTVGACAVDSGGACAGAVSTGGIWLKLPGRVGDVPLPGAGIWVAPDGSGVAVSTGTGESLLRTLLCREAVDFMDSRSAQDACDAAIALLTRETGPGQGGLIAVDRRGFGWGLSTRGMGRAVWREGMEEPAVAVWPGEGWDRTVSA